MSQLRVQQPSLNRIHSAVVAFGVVMVLFHLAVVAQHLNLSSQIYVVCGYCPTLATGSKVFPWVEAERSRPADGPSLHPAIELIREVFGSVRLTSILDHDEIVLAGQPEDRIHISHLAVEVHWYYRRHRSATPHANEFPCFISRALPFQKLSQHLGGDIVGVLINVDELGDCSRL